MKYIFKSKSSLTSSKTFVKGANQMDVIGVSEGVKTKLE